MKFCSHGSNLMRKFKAILEHAFRESDKNIPLSLSLSTPLSKDEEVNDIGHSISIGILILGVNSVTFS